MRSPPKFAVMLLLSLLMLAGTGIAWNFDLRRFDSSPILSILIEVVVPICVFGWLPMLVAALVVLRRQSRSATDQ